MFISLCLADRTEQRQLLAYGLLDGFRAGEKKLARIKALALKISAFLDVLAGRRREAQLALSIYVDLGNSERDPS